jgi:hypothetical protein
MNPFPSPTIDTRLGFHYFPDALHYRDKDLQTWLPELKSLGASWLTLAATPQRAIPEFFLNGLISAGIEPIVHIFTPLKIAMQAEALRPLLRSYARWGIHYIALFDRPNLRAAWEPASWSQTDLIERFLDIYLPLAAIIVQEGMYPVFPPLEPGGDFWDTAFLRAALRAIRRRGFSQVQNSIVLGTYAWSYNRPLDWGAGGPEKWPEVRPYYTPAGNQDQIGFNIFEWYQAIAQAEFERPVPILLLRAGSRPGDHLDSSYPATSLEAHAERNLAISQLLKGASGQPPLSSNILACNFWLLAADPGTPHYSQAWFQSYPNSLPVVNAFRRWRAGAATPSKGLEKPAPTVSNPTEHPISHYLLLPPSGARDPELNLDAIAPYIQIFKPTVGFSLEEASLAARVTVINGQISYPDKELEKLRAQGCIVERIGSNGTDLATLA